MSPHCGNDDDCDDDDCDDVDGFDGDDDDVFSKLKI